MIRSMFVDIQVNNRTQQILALPPGQRRVALRFAAPSESAYLVTSAQGGQFVLRAAGQDVELTRDRYGDLLDVAWMVTPVALESVTPDVISILISQEV